MTGFSGIRKGRSLWRRTPPALFPVILGLLGLGLALRQMATRFAIAKAPGEALLGAASLLLVAGFLAYAIKATARPSVVAEDIRVLPGRAGLAAMVLSFHVFSLAALPYSAVWAGRILFAALVLHGLFAVVFLAVLGKGPPEQRRVSPIWHLVFVGPVIGAVAAARLGQELWALGFFAVTAVIAALIWVVSIGQIGKAAVPPPLRPLLAIHLAPAAFLGILAEALGLEGTAAGFAALSLTLLLVLVFSAPWLLAGGFTPLWGALTFPLAAASALWLTLGGWWGIAGVIAVTAAAIIVPAIAFAVLRLWPSGQLAARTNAATA